MQRKRKKHLFIATGLLAGCLLLSACNGNGGGDDTGGYYPVETIPPEGTIEQTGDQEFKESIVSLMTDMANDPDYLKNKFLTPDSNFRVTNISVSDDSGMTGEVSGNISDIYVTGNKSHTVYFEDEYGDGFTDSYTFWGDYGSYTINYDGFDYFYEFEPSGQQNESSALYEALTVEDVKYESYSNVYYIESDVVREYCRFIMENGMSDEDEMIDTSSFMENLDNTNFSLIFSDPNNLGKISSIKARSTTTTNDLSRDVFALTYSDDGTTKTISLKMNDQVDIAIDGTITSISDYETSVSMNVTIDSGLISLFDANISASATIIEDDNNYFVVSGFLRDNALTAERVINHMTSLEDKYNATYYTEVKEGITPCPIVYLYDSQTKAYIILNHTGDGYYSYAGVDIEYDKDDVCFGEIDDEDSSLIHVTTHIKSEQIDRELRNKFNKNYASSVKCNSIQVYDENLRVWAIFERNLDTNTYKYDRYIEDQDSTLYCVGTINMLVDEINVMEHSSLEQLIDSVKNREFALDGYIHNECVMVSCYDFDTNKYLIFGINDGKAYYTCVVDSDIDLACSGSLNVNSGSIYIDSHAPLADDFWGDLDFDWN